MCVSVCEEENEEYVVVNEISLSEVFVNKKCSLPCTQVVPENVQHHTCLHVHNEFLLPQKYSTLSQDRTTPLNMRHTWQSSQTQAWKIQRYNTHHFKESERKRKNCICYRCASLLTWCNTKSIFKCGNLDFRKALSWHKLNFDGWFWLCSSIKWLI